MSSSTFTHAPTQTHIHVPAHLAGAVTDTALLSFKPFTSWLSTLHHSLSLQHTDSFHAFHDNPYVLRSVSVQAVDFFGPRIGFLKAVADVRTRDGGEKAGASLPGSLFLRGGSVAMLVILETEDAGEGRTRSTGSVDAGGERWVVLTVQPRVPAGSLAMVELPAGMIDDAGTFSGAAAKELSEECGLKIKEEKLIDLTALAFDDEARRGQGKAPETTHEHLQTAFYPSPGGSDEFIKVFAYRHRIARETLHEWQGKLTGLRESGEMISLKIVPLRDLWKETRDSKALAAVALWDGLVREGRL